MEKINCKDCKWYPSGPMGLEENTCWCLIKKGTEFASMDKANRFGTCCFFKTNKSLFTRIIEKIKAVME